MDVNENEQAFFTFISHYEKLFCLAKDLAETNSYELPYRGEELIERAIKLLKELEPV